VAERMIEANDVELCTEPFGDSGDPPLLLIAGTGSSMLWWDAELCRMLASRGRFVIRYDHRDTGRSVTYEPGRPGYSGAALDDDAAAVLGAYGIEAAHLVGVSAGAGIAQLVALDSPERVLSLVLISTTAAVSIGRALPPPTADFGRFVSTARVDWSDEGSMIEYIVDYTRVLAGGERPFDEAEARDLIRREVERARDYAAVRNHDLLTDDARPREPLSSISVPTLVVHGSADPMFPLGHGQALAQEIPGARLLTLEGAGHGVYRADWDALVDAIAEQTGG
jgi:pimeloyl-ACP methyl ester carboxylesterase